MTPQEEWMNPRAFKPLVEAGYPWGGDRPGGRLRLADCPEVLERHLGPAAGLRAMSGGRGKDDPLRQQLPWQDIIHRDDLCRHRRRTCAASRQYRLFLPLPR